MSSKIEDAARRAEDVIDREYAPEKMTPREAVEFLEYLSSGIDAKIDALKEENDF